MWFTLPCYRKPLPFRLDFAFGRSYAKTMLDVELTSDQKAFVGQAIESGRIRAEEDAVREALLLWERRERVRAELLSALDEAEASLACGEGVEMTEQSTRELAERVKQRGRASLAAERASSRQ